MLTNNAKKLLTSSVTTPKSGSTYSGVYEAADGSFVLHNNNTTNKILNSQAESSEDIAKIRCVSTLAISFYGYRGLPHFRIVKKSALPTDTWSASTLVCIVCTHDQEDSPITPDAVNVPGNDLSDALQTVSAIQQNNYALTITFNNASDSVMHVNRLGFYMGVQAYPYSSTGGGSMLMHLFAFDDIALAPGETKSITIQPDLD